jgi:hypothetical protein
MIDSIESFVSRYFGDIFSKNKFSLVVAICQGYPRLLSDYTPIFSCQQDITYFRTWHRHQFVVFAGYLDRRPVMAKIATFLMRLNKLIKRGSG